MRTLVNSNTEQVRATGIHFVGNVLYISLSDEREIRVPLERVAWLGWLATATSEQLAKWSLEPGGFAVYWEELDDGIEVGRLLEAS